MKKINHKHVVMFIWLFFTGLIQAVDNPFSHCNELTDCGVIKYNGEYYLVGGWLDGDMIYSHDLESWGQRRHVFSYVNTWHTPINPTYPDEAIKASHVRYYNGFFHLYTQAGEYITHAVCNNIWGPYQEVSVDTPFAGRIDADTFLDDDGSFYFYSTQFYDGENQIYGRTMSDLWTLSGSYMKLLDPGAISWESNINEGSKVFKYRDRYYMLYSGNHTDDPDYQIGCCEASSALGFSNSGKYSIPVIPRAAWPGDSEIMVTGQAWVVDGLNCFEKWVGYKATYEGNRRQCIDRLHFFDRTLYVDGPTNRFTPGYHPGPAKPQLRGLFNRPDGTVPSDDWERVRTFTQVQWSINDSQLVQSDESSLEFYAVNRDESTNYLFEASLRFTDTLDAEEKAGVLAYYNDTTNWMVVGFDRVHNSWYYHRREAGVDTMYAYTYASGEIDFTAYHTIRVYKNGSVFNIMIDGIPAPGESSNINSAFSGAGRPGLYTDHAASAFDGVTYTIGWDEYDDNITGWESIAGFQESGSWSVTSSGLVQTSTDMSRIFKGDLMPQYEVSIQIEKYDTTEGYMGFCPVAIDPDNYLLAVIRYEADTLQVRGRIEGEYITIDASVNNADSYNLRAVKLADRVIVYVDGEEKVVVNELFPPSHVGLYTDGMRGRFNGMMVYQFEAKSLPSPWQNADIGNVQPMAGYAEYTDGIFTVNGPGTSISTLGTGNGYHYVYLDLVNDCSITARILSMDEADSESKAGLMIQQDLDDDSIFAALAITPEGYLQYVLRSCQECSPVINKNTKINLDPQSDPVWLRLERSGNLVIAYYSLDAGQTWVFFYSYPLALTSDVKVGLFSCSETSYRINDAVFDNVEYADSNNNTASVITSTNSIIISEELSTTDTFDVWLSKAPQNDNVVIDFVCDANQILLDVNNLMFTTSDWNTPQTVTVTAVDDADYEADPTDYIVTATVADGSDGIYTSTEISNITVSVADNDCGSGRYLPGDVDKNCIVNIQDFALLASNWFECSLPNVDGCVTP